MDAPITPQNNSSPVPGGRPRFLSASVGDLAPGILKPDDDTDKANMSWRWLGNFKRSLSYGEESSSSSRPSPPPSPTTSSVSDDGSDGISSSAHSLSDDNIAALDAVFKNEGTSREANRMRSVLIDLADTLAQLKERSSLLGEVGPMTAHTISPLPSSEPERLVELLLEVRDICQDRTDFSLAFVAMGGLDVLLGCASEREAVLKDVRSACFLVLSSVAMGSVPVQLRLLNDGAVRVLASLYFAEFPKEEESGGDEEGTTAKMTAEADDSGMLRGRIVQAIDAAVVGHMVAERRFCDSERGRRVVEAGMGIAGANQTLPGRPWEAPDPSAASPPAALRKRSLSLLRELVTSRFTTQDRAESFQSALRHAATKMTVPEFEQDERVRELALGLVVKVLRQKKKGASVIKGMKDELGVLGERRIEEIQSMDAVEREVTGDTERDLWFRITTELGRA